MTTTETTPPPRPAPTAEQSDQLARSAFALTAPKLWRSEEDIVSEHIDGDVEGWFVVVARSEKAARLAAAVKAIEADEVPGGPEDELANLRALYEMHVRRHGQLLAALNKERTLNSPTPEEERHLAAGGRLLIMRVPVGAAETVDDVAPRAAGMAVASMMRDPWPNPIATVSYDEEMPR